MTTYHRIRRQQLLREAEGYLDLIMVFADQWSPTPTARDRLAQRALDILRDADNSHSDTAYAYYLEGQALRAMERYPEAVIALRASAQEDPVNVLVWLALGWCYKRIGRLDLAVESLEEALTLDGEEALVHITNE